jgi:UDPglucose 6-dehydrogenase
MNVAVVGTGYVGLVSGTCFAETGNNVICVDIDQDKVTKLKGGELTIYEPGLELVFKRNVSAGRLHFTTELTEAVEQSDIIFLALPTPPGADGSADLKYILGVAQDLSDIITTYKVIVDKSTVPVGTAEQVHQVLAERLSEELFDVVSNPEFLREGVAVDDFMKPERIVIGTSSPRAQKAMEQLYSPFVRQGNPIYFMDKRSAEMTKYAANSFLATKITFMNEIANLCDLTGANVDKVRLGMGSDSRIGKRFLFPGVGYGGSCFPKDVQALEKTATNHEYDFKILKSVMEVNRSQKNIAFDRLQAFYGETLKDKNIAIWGLSFKPNTDDIREAPAIYLLKQLLEIGCTVQAFDPEAMDNVKDIFGDKVSFAKSQYDALDGADSLVIMTEWGVFRNPDFDIIKSQIGDGLLFDGRNLFDPDDMKSQGLNYESIGRPV